MKISYSTQVKSLNLGLFRLPTSLSLLFKSESYVVEHVTGSGFYKYLLDLDSYPSKNFKMKINVDKCKKKMKKDVKKSVNKSVNKCKEV